MSAKMANRVSLLSSPRSDSPAPSLPPMLSPTLPSWTEDGLPKRMLSPTLPPEFDDVPLHHPVPKRVSKSFINEPSPLARERRVNEPNGNGHDPNGEPNVETNGRRPSLTVTLKVKSLRKLQAIANGTNKGLGITEIPEPSPPKAKKSKVSRSYSSSEEEDEPKPVLHSVALDKPETKLETASSPVRSSNSSIPKEKREKYYRLLKGKMRKWIELARQKKHESDSAIQADELDRAAVLSMDSLLSFIVAFDYEERADGMMGRDVNANSWATLIPFIGRLIHMFETAGYAALVGVCYQVRALVHERTATCHSANVKKLTTQTDDDTDEKIKRYSLKYIAAQESASQDFRRGFTHLDIGVLKTGFPATWKNRHASPRPVSKHEGGYRPLEDPYYVPLHVFSSLQEGAALAYAMIKEWADAHHIECEWALVKGLE